jgi:hypothetical protein
MSLNKNAHKPPAARLGAVLILTLSCLALAACAGGHDHTANISSATRPRAAQATTAPRPTGPGGFLASDADADQDDAGKQSFYLKPSRHDSFVTEGEGPKATAADRRAVTTLVKRYYAAGAAEDGARACPMLSSALRAGLSETWGSTGRTGGGTGCTMALSLFFRQQRQLLEAADVATMVVVDVRVRDDRATALLGFRAIPVGSIHIEREHGVWRMDDLLHKALPS